MSFAVKTVFGMGWGRNLWDYLGEATASIRAPIVTEVTSIPPWEKSKTLLPYMELVLCSKQGFGEVSVKRSLNVSRLSRKE